MTVTINRELKDSKLRAMKQDAGMNGDEAIAYATKQCRVGVVAAYPITPQTIIVEQFSQYVADGDVDTEFVCVESEHSALSTCIGSSATGVRVFTATSSQGLALMHEVLYAASGLRCPIVMAVANRALSAPINIHGDHSDMMGSRDSGWIQVYVENAQEAYDWTIMAFKIAEDLNVLLPITVNIDGFTLTHSMENLRLLSQEEVDSYLPPRVATIKLDPKNPITIGSLALPEFYYELKRQQEGALQEAQLAIDRVAPTFAKLSNREYGQIETFRLDDADACIVCLGSSAGTARHVARKLRREGKKVGVLKISVYRPFPTEAVASALRQVKAIAVLDRSMSFGAPLHPLASDVSAAITQGGLSPKMINFVGGLGGRDITPEDLEGVFIQTLEAAAKGTDQRSVVFMGVRE